MNPYTLTLLRHGEIDHAGRLIGSGDLPLNALGQAQMAQSWQRICSLAPVTAIASSPLQRCREFAVQHALHGSLTLKVNRASPRWTLAIGTAWRCRCWRSITRTGAPSWQPEN